MRLDKWFPVLMACLVVGIASESSAATSWKRLGANPFYRPALSSEADLKNLVKTRSADLKAGFAKAGYPELYPAFMEQFPAAKIDSVTVGYGETFAWIVFKKKATGQVSVLKDATWRGPVAFEAYRFTIDSDGKRHEFVVPYACGNVALRSVAAISARAGGFRSGANASDRGSGSGSASGSRCGSRSGSDCPSRAGPRRRVAGGRQQSAAGSGCASKACAAARRPEAGCGGCRPRSGSASAGAGARRHLAGGIAVRRGLLTPA
jgi:hypothetical protein